MNSKSAFLRNSEALWLIMNILSRCERVKGAMVRQRWLKLPPDVKKTAFGQGTSFWVSVCSELIIKVAAVHFSFRFKGFKTALRFFSIKTKAI